MEAQSKSYFYRIKIKGCLPCKFSKWFNNMEIKNLKENETVLEGNVEDQSALYGILLKIRDMGLPLIFLEKVEQPEKGK